MSNQFNELLLQTLKEIGVRLERLEGRGDHVINEKADKIDVNDVKTELKDVKAELKTDINGVKTELNDVKAELKDVNEKLDLKADKTDINDVKAELKDVKVELKTDVSELWDELRSHGRRLDRIETGIKTLQWTMTAGLAVLGIVLAFLKAF